MHNNTTSSSSSSSRRRTARNAATRHHPCTFPRATNDDMAYIPAYSFPLIQGIYNDLNNQLLTNPQSENLIIRRSALAQLTSLLNRIDTNGIKVPLSTIFLLIKKLQSSSGTNQKRYIKSILFIFDRFVTIERCMLLQRVGDFNILYKVDELFDVWLERLLCNKINDDFLEKFNNSISNELDNVMAGEDIDIEELHRCIHKDEQDMTLQNGIFINMRNIFILFARRFGLRLPTPMYTVFGILQYCGDAICKNIVSIDIVLNIFSKFYVENDVALSYVRSTLELYCAINKQVKSDRLLRWVMKFLEDHKKKRPAGVLERELYEDAYQRMMQLFERDTSKRIEEEIRPPLKKEFFSRRSGALTRGMNDIIKRTEEFVQEKIYSLNLDMETTSLLLGTAIALKKSIQIEGWDGFIRSFNKHSRMMLGERFSGKVPETPFSKLLNGKVFVRLNRNTFLVNMTVLLPFAYPIVIKKVGRFLDYEE